MLARLSIVFGLLAAILSINGPVSGQSTWIGPTGGQWSTNSNWSPGGPPGPNVFINSDPSNVIVNLDVNAGVTNLTIDAGDQLVTFAGRVFGFSNLFGNGQLIIEGDSRLNFSGHERTTT